MPHTHVTFEAPAFLDAADEEAEPLPLDAAAGAERGDDDARDDDARDADARDADDGWGEGPPPPGERLATWLAEQLEARGWRVLNRWTTPYGHAFDVQRGGGRRFDVEVRAREDAPEGAWLVTAKPRAGLLRRVFSGGADPEAHALLCTHLHEILLHDPRVSGIAWFDEEAWDAGDRTGGDRSPGH